MSFHDPWAYFLIGWESIECIKNTITIILKEKRCWGGDSQPLTLIELDQYPQTQCQDSKISEWHRRTKGGPVRSDIQRPNGWRTPRAICQSVCDLKLCSEHILPRDWRWTKLMSFCFSCECKALENWTYTFKRDFYSVCFASQPRACLESLTKSILCAWASLPAVLCFDFLQTQLWSIPFCYGLQIAFSHASLHSAVANMRNGKIKKCVEEVEGWSAHGRRRDRYSQ